MQKIKLVIEGSTDANELAQVLRDIADRIEADVIVDDEYVENDLVINIETD